MSMPLFKVMLKSNWKLIFICTAIALFYLLTIIGMYSPESSVIAAPDAFSKAYGMNVSETDAMVFVSSAFFELSYFLVLICYTVIASTRLMAHLVDRGSMGYLLASSVSRTAIASTQALVLVAGLVIIVTTTTLGGIIGFKAVLPGVEFDTAKFIIINLVELMLFAVIAGYSFLFSCLFSNQKTAAGASAVLTVLFYGINITSRVSEIGWLSNLSIFKTFNPMVILHGVFSFLWTSLGLIVASVILFNLAVMIFNRKNLTI